MTTFYHCENLADQGRIIIQNIDNSNHSIVILVKIHYHIVYLTVIYLLNVHLIVIYLLVLIVSLIVIY